jgi:hypothetical protein
MLKMKEKQTITPKSSTQKLEFTGEVISMNILADRCHEVILSDYPYKYEALSSQIETIQRMLLPEEYTTRFAEIHSKVEHAIAHNQIEESELLRAEVGEILANDPVAQDARHKAITMLSGAIDPRYKDAFYATLNGGEVFSVSAPPKFILLGYKVLETVMKYGNLKQNK